MEKFVSSKVANVGDDKLSRGGQIKDRGSRGPPNLGASSYANAVSRIDKVMTVDQVSSKDDDGKRLPLGPCLNERGLVEEWVKQLASRGCCEEKIMVDLGDKSMLVHAVLLNPPSGLKGQNTDLRYDDSGKPSIQGVLNDERLKESLVDQGSVGSFDDPIVDAIMEDGVSQVSDIWDSDRGIELLFPEISDQNGGFFNHHDLIQKGVGLTNAQNGHEDHNVASPVFEVTEPTVPGPTNDIVVLSNNEATNVVLGYSGPWAPGYFKGSCSGVKKKSGDDRKGCSSLSSKGLSTVCRDSSTRWTNGEQINDECESKGHSNSSDLSLPPGFASAIPSNVIKSAKLKKKKDNMLKIGKTKVKTGKDGSASVTSVFKKNRPKASDNSITSKGMMDFAKLMGLDVQGKEIETERKFAKILQDERKEWERFKLEI